MNILPKMYDMKLAARFNLWYKPNTVQAGGQKGRGCEEQIFLIDIARKSKQKLYITFIDYQKAYDKLNRYILLRMLDSKGCGFLNLYEQSGTQCIVQLVLLVIKCLKRHLG